MNRSRSRSRSPPPKPNYRKRSPEEPPKKRDSYNDRKKPIEKEEEKKPKKLPFIGRMPLFKNKKPEEKVEAKEIKKESYDIPRQTRFQPGNLAKAFIPAPDVVCFPKLSSFPSLEVPEPPKISESPPKPVEIKKKKQKVVAAIVASPKKAVEPVKIDKTETIMIPDGPPPDYAENMNNMYPPPPPINFNYDYNMVYPHPTFDYSEVGGSEPKPPLPMAPMAPVQPLQPPPLPPDQDDLAMLGISSDDLAAQRF